MKAGRTMATAVGAALLATGLFAAPSVEITAVQQQYPWTNTVDITYEVRGVTNMEYFVRFTPTTKDDDPILNTEGEASIQVALESNGVFTAQWYPQTNLQYTACKMTPAIFRGGSGGGNDYMIVDLLTGEVTYEPMATQEASNERYQATEYKTTKLVLRRVPAKDYYIGEADNNEKIGAGLNPRRSVNIPVDYYIGIYEITESQYDRVVSGKASTVITPPYASIGVSYNEVRGNALPAATPTKGFFANLNKLTRKTTGFDLPTESMWEIASRAESLDKWVSGNTADNLGKYAWMSGNSGDARQTVGTKLPNAWGIYDMAGNSWELVRDRFNAGILGDLQPNGLVPISNGTASSAVLRGGAMWDRADTLRHSFRYSFNTSGNTKSVGFRVAYITQ